MKRLCSFSKSSFRQILIYNFRLGNGILSPLEGRYFFCLRPMSDFFLLEKGQQKIIMKDKLFVNETADRIYGMESLNKGRFFEMLV